MSKSRKAKSSKRQNEDIDDGHLFNDHDLATLNDDGLTEPLAKALETIAVALRANLVPQPQATLAVSRPRQTRPRAVTVHSKSVGLHLTLVINPLRDDKE